MERLVPPPPHLINLTISIFFTLLLCKSVSSDIGFISSCITPTVDNETSYNNSLQTLFSNLNSTITLDYESTAGESPNKAYGLYLCRLDASPDACSACIGSIIHNLSLKYDNCKEAYAYMENCTLHHANYSFFGISNNRVSKLMHSKFIATDYEGYNRTLEGVLQDVISNATKNAPLAFAIRKSAVQVVGQETVYALAQCTQDLDSGGCRQCLSAALVTLTNITYSQPGLSKSAVALLPSCQLRYDNVNFFGTWPNIGEAPSNDSPAAVSAFLLATLNLFLIHLFLC